MKLRERRAAQTAVPAEWVREVELTKARLQSVCSLLQYAEDGELIESLLFERLALNRRLNYYFAKVKQLENQSVPAPEAAADPLDAASVP